MTETSAAKTVSLQPAIDGHLSPSERTSLYRTFIAAEQEHILSLHNDGGGGNAVARARGNH